MAVEVKFGRVPGRLDNGVLNEGTTFHEALRQLNVTVGADEVVSVNGDVVDLSATVSSLTRSITVAKRVKGNH